LLKDITMGQYFPGDSPIHRIDPRFKIVITFVMIFTLFWGGGYWGLIFGGTLTFFAMTLSKIPFKLFVKSVKPMFMFLLFMAFFNILFIKTGTVYWQWQFLKITSAGVETSVFMLIRVTLLVFVSSLLTYTTSPIVLTDAIEHLFSPLKKLRFPVHELAMMMTIALRFIPTLIEETDKIMSAQKARGAEIDSGSILTRVKNFIPILIPLFISSFRRAEELATAMECRCYNGGKGRTKLRQMKSGIGDIAALIISLLFFGAVVTLGIIKQ